MLVRIGFCPANSGRTKLSSNWTARIFSRGCFLFGHFFPWVASSWSIDLAKLKLQPGRAAYDPARHVRDLDTNSKQSQEYGPVVVMVIGPCLSISGSESRQIHSQPRAT